MGHTVTHERTASRERARIDEDGGLIPQLRQHDSRIEIDQVGMRSRSPQARHSGIVDPVRIVTRGAGSAGRQMSAVAASGARCPERISAKARVAQDAGPIVTAVTQGVVVVAFRGVVRGFVALLKIGANDEPCGPREPPSSSA